jgi:heterodisulfide reductase subunit A-like polyferredoxin
LKNAKAFKEQNPEARVTILYKDIRVYGFNERLYSEVRDLGVIFLRYDEKHQPEISFAQKNNTNPKETITELVVTAWDKPLQRQVELRPDLIVLSMPVVPHPDMKELANLFKVSTDTYGFFLEAHVKLRPVDFSTEGVYMAGLAHYPKLLTESIIQAQAAASRALVILSQDFLKAGGSIAVVDQENCTGCLTCVRVCPFDVPYIDNEMPGIGGLLGTAWIEATVCQGCGICVAECPAKAIELMHFTDAQLKSKVTALFNPDELSLQMV